MRLSTLTIPIINNPMFRFLTPFTIRELLRVSKLRWSVLRPNAKTAVAVSVDMGVKWQVMQVVWELRERYIDVPAAVLLCHRI